MGRFDDRATQPMKGPGDMLKWKVLRKSDLPTLGKLGDAPLYIVPVGNGARIAKLGKARNIVELDWWQTHEVGELKITLVPARRASGSWTSAKHALFADHLPNSDRIALPSPPASRGH